MAGLNLTPNEAAKHGLAIRQDGVRRTRLGPAGLPDVDFAALTRIWPELAALSPISSSSWRSTPICRLSGPPGRRHPGLPPRRGPRPARRLDYGAVIGLSNEVRQKLEAHPARTLGQAARIEGVTAAALTLSGPCEGPEEAQAVPDFGPEEFAAQTGVSRETLARLKAYADLLADWNERHNLVARSSLADLWRRHFWDSAQLAPLSRQRPNPGRSGLRRRLSGPGAGGNAAAGSGRDPVEATAKKCAFLRAAAERMDLPVTIENARMEDLPRAGL